MNSNLTLAEASRRIHSGDLTPTRLVDACLTQTETNNDTLNAFLTVLADSAREQAAQATAAINRGEDWGSLHGIPVGIKDLIDVEGVPTTAASPVLKEHTAAQNADVVTSLLGEGAIVLGKTHLHEFAVGATNMNPHFGPARNPYHTEHLTGGSSGGSAAAVASGMVLGALGTDTGGSVRIPSALCNLTGLRPALGQLSTRGVLPMSWTLDTVGPMARTAEDIALLMDALVPEPTGYASALGESVSGLRIGMPVDDDYWLDTSTEIVLITKALPETFDAMGLRNVEVQLPGIGEIYRAAGLISISEAAAYHYDRLTNSPEQYGIDVRRRLERGLRHSAVEYAVARQRGREWRAHLHELFAQIDVLALPTTAQSAPRVDEADLWVSLNLLRFTYPFSLSGLPSLSMPCGFTEEGLPVGVQLVAPHTDVLLRVAHAYQQVTDWHGRLPQVT